MSREFVEQKIGSRSIAEARRQQEELSYFTKSEIQKPITQEYLNQWAERKYAGSDQFLNWVKTIFGTNNFLSFYKFLRNPVPSAKVVNNKIKPQLERVFFAEDSFFKYTIKGQQVENPDNLDSVHFSEWMLDAMMFRHNDILITDLKDTNTPFRELISIENVVALRSERSVIKQLAYTAAVPVTREDGTVEVKNGFLYMDDMEYIFYDDKFNPVLVIPHDLGECPADYITPQAFSDDDIVRKSLFSFVKPDLEEFTFLKTLQRMTEPNGAIPVTAILKFPDKDDDSDNSDVDSDTDNQPPIPMSISSQQSRLQGEVVGKPTEVQTGTIIDVKARLKDDQSIDAAAVQNYIKHFYMPVEAMKYLNERIAELQNDIIQSVTGDFKEQNEAAQNEKQVSKGYITKEDSLRQVSKGLSRIRKRSDFKMLSMEFGPNTVTNEAFYGSDFFPESQKDLFEQFDTAPNPIERKNTLIRLNKNKNRFNKDKAERQEIQYHLMPYVSDKDFDAAREDQRVGAIEFQYYTRFNYWIGAFEALYGDLLLFWEGMEDQPDSAKLIVINNLITDLITKAGLNEPESEQTNTIT